MTPDEQPIPWFVVVICVGAGVLLIVMGIPLLLRRVPPKDWGYGVRIPSTLADESVWYDINARGGRHFVVIGLLYLVVFVAAVTLGRSWSVELRILVPVALLVVALVADAIVLGVAARRLLAQRQRKGGL
jgi:uncharacterized membrane protein